MLQHHVAMVFLACADVRAVLACDCVSLCVSVSSLYLRLIGPIVTSRGHGRHAVAMPTKPWDMTGRKES